MKKKVWVTRDEDGLASMWAGKKPEYDGEYWDGENLILESWDSENYGTLFGNRKFGLKPGGIKQMTLEITLTDG